MSNHTNITRRRFLQSAPSAALIAAIPPAAAIAVISASAPATASEPICDRIDHLSQELSVALAEYLGGRFYAVVKPCGSVWLRRCDDGPLLADDATGTTAFADWEAKTAQEDQPYVDMLGQLGRKMKVPL